MALVRSQSEEASPPLTSRIGRDEMNLAEFPIALLADYAPKGQKTIYFEGGDGQLTVTGSDAYGLPTALDADVIVALIYLTKLRNDFRDVKVNFSRYELIKMLNWPDKGSSYNRLDQALNRWGGVWLVYDKCWWNNRLKRYVSAKMHILECVVITEPGKIRGGQGELPLSTFTWNKTFIESCQADNLRQLDLDTYFSLKSAVAKRLYRFMGKRFYRQDDWTFDLNEIAFERVGLSRSYARDAGKIKEKLQPAIEELEAIGFLRPLSRNDRYTRIDRGQWTIRLTRQSPTAVAFPPPTQPPAEPEPSGLVTELINRGVTKVTAAELVQQHPANAIAAKIEVFDWLTEKKDKRVEKSPAGYLVKSITDDYAQPKGFVSKAERQRRAEARQAKEHEAAEDRRRKQEEGARERAEQEAADAYWASLSAEEQSRLEADALADGGDEARQTLETMKRLRGGSGYQTLLRRAYIIKLMRESRLAPAEA